MADSRKSINTIHNLTDENGNRYESQEEISAHCADYFENLFNDQDEATSMEQSDMNLLLSYRYITAAIREFFSSGSLLKQWNVTTLTLIPKSVNATTAADFRPISCLNTLYKVIAKLLTNRLQSLLSTVVSPFQSAFLPGRSLAENVLLATEMVHGYNWRNISPRGMLKVDLRKAFDSVRWDFVISALRAIQLPERFINWVYQCISTPSFTVCVNGCHGGFFKSSKGLRQGDPLSPYLFVLAMEVFSKLLQTRFDAGYIQYHPKASDLSISHLMFADDVMIFFDGGHSSLHGICETLDDFASWSGLKVNKDKSQLFHGGLENNGSLMLETYGFPLGALPIRYLGLPLMHRRLRIAEYEPLLEKISSKFRSWVTKSLSFAGRLQLISSVIFGSINFWMSTFILPKGCIKRIESLCARFLWSGNIDEGKGAKVVWEVVCLPKSEGGLGLRRLSDWNRTLLLKLVWRLFEPSNSLWAAWHHLHHLRNDSLWDVHYPTGASWAWKTLLNLRPLAEKFIKCRVGNGFTASFWFDSWTLLGPLINRLGDYGARSLRIPISAKVVEAIEGAGWRLPLSRSPAAREIHDHLRTLQPPSPEQDQDVYIWCVDNKPYHRFSTAATWEAMRPRKPKQSWTKSIWFRGAVPKFAFHMWVSHLNRLPTRQRLSSWGIIQFDACCLCSIASETRDHIFLVCEFAAQVWKLTFTRICPRQRLFSSWSELLSWTRQASPTAPSLIRKLSAQVVVYNLWRQRNNILHNSFRLAPSIIFKFVDREMKDIITSRGHRKRWQDLLPLWVH
ncbi:PREDICTED: uncharacterized protein LOC104705067 [Camelina sativa]|uniref:Uncharacterized protein LOC104705067 n=1 Tax=Camelina sativa TaxID=90675 RepID=A0ABM0T1A0_CAMSA|nr:PREDICTED: uncharacterized protein LOC104705067 [Camelina sativa]